MILPSKKLLSEVTRIPIEAISSINIGRSDLSIFKTNDIVEVYNIYELQHKMKEWAYSKGFKILDECNAIIITTLTDREVHIEDEDFKIPYKLDRFFKACEWVYKEINK